MGPRNAEFLNALAHAHNMSDVNIAAGICLTEEPRRVDPWQQLALVAVVAVLLGIVLTLAALTVDL